MVKCIYRVGKSQNWDQVDSDDLPTHIPTYVPTYLTYYLASFVSPIEYFGFDRANWCL